MKIAFFNYQMLEYGGGLAKYYREITTGLKARYPHLDLTIVTFDEAFDRKIQKLYAIYFFTYGKTFEKIEHSQSIRQKLKGVSYVKAKNLRDLKRIFTSFDIIYSKNDFVEAAILKLAGVSGSTRILFGFHTPVFYDMTQTLQDKFHNTLYSSFFYTFLVKNVKRFHVLNNFDKNLLKKRFPSIPVSFIPNPFDFAAFAKKANQYVYNLHVDAKKTTILWVGRLTKEKGILDLEKIISEVNKHYKRQVTWVIVGDGPLSGTINSLQNNLRNIIHLKSVENDFIASIYKRADLFISTSHFECFPYTFLEAQSFGIPIICYDIHGCNDIITHKKNGLLVKDLKDFSQAISKLLTNTIFNKETIKTFIAKKYDKEKLYKSFYDTLIQK